MPTAFSKFNKPVFQESYPQIIICESSAKPKLSKYVDVNVIPHVTFPPPSSYTHSLPLPPTLTITIQLISISNEWAVIILIKNAIVIIIRITSISPPISIVVTLVCIRGSSAVIC